MRELYFDISSEETGGSLYRITNENAVPYFDYNYSTYDSKLDEIKVFDKKFSSFDEFWKEITKNPEWFYLHPLFVHPEQREFVREQLKNVNWNIHPNKKWQDSHQRQWKKVLSDPGDYYRNK